MLVERKTLVQPPLPSLIQAFEVPIRQDRVRQRPAQDALTGEPVAGCVVEMA
tara:strand:- start:497 stop:652 length:156 start_codon:yes stop_codon:yes gene_type:complete